MTPRRAPHLDQRDAASVLADVLRRLPAYVPGWSPKEGRASSALLQVFARYMEALIERLNQVPDKNLLAFLDLLGQSLAPAEAARAPFVFDFRPPAPPTVPATIIHYWSWFTDKA